MNNAPENDLASRVHRARQVLAGSDVLPPDDPIDFASEPGLVSPEQRVYLIALTVLLAIGLILTFTLGFGIASIIFLLLALALFAGWFIF